MLPKVPGDKVLATQRKLPQDTGAGIKTHVLRSQLQPLSPNFSPVISIVLMALAEPTLK